MSSKPQTILFLGATGGCGFSALRRSLAAGHTCIALCRTPSKLSAKLSDAEKQAPNLRLEQGNAHDIDALMRVVAHPTKPQSLVDVVLFSIGGAFSFKAMSIDDPKVCDTGMEALVTALARARAEKGLTGSPRIVAISSTGITDSGKRDVPLLFVPLYHVLLKEPHKDKKNMEQALIKSGEERWTIIRPSLLTDGAESASAPRVGVEDPAKAAVESSAIGYTISREDVGKWIFENLVESGDARWEKRAVTLTN